MKKLLVFATLALIAAACSSTPSNPTVTTVGSRAPGSLPVKPNPNTFDVTGLLEVTVSGLNGDAKNAKATAVFHSMNKFGNLGAKAITVNAGTITLTQKFTSTFDMVNGSKRYVQTGFYITNSSTFDYANMTLIATSLATATTDSGVVTTVGGTAISNMVNGTGGPITDAAVARSIVPTHGFFAGFSYQVNAGLADMQYLMPAEAAAAKTQGESSG